MINTTTLDAKLAGLASRFQTYDRSSFTWEVKILFAQLFESEENCYRYANAIDDPTYKLIDGDNEFMFDLVVLREEKHNGGLIDEDYIIDTILALETELDDSFHSVVVDFQKLLLSNADEKVIIFKCHSDEFAERCDYLKLCTSKYRKSQGIFHLVARLNDTSEIKRETFQL